MTDSNPPNRSSAATSPAPGSLSLTLTLALALVPSISEAAASLSLGLQDLNGGYESNRTAFLTWTAEPDRVYRVQSSTNLSDAAAWKTEDAVTRSTVGPLKWMSPESIRERMYYRLVLPRKSIEAIEPAVIPPGAAVDLYIIGQDFAPTDVLRVNGTFQPGLVFSNATMLALPGFTPDVPGTYRFELVASGLVVSSFQVICADPVTDPNLVLQDPPEDPPAAPLRAVGRITFKAKEGATLAGSKGIVAGKPGSGNPNGRATGGGDDCDDENDSDPAVLSKRGYDYYKAQSDLAAAGLQTNPAFQDSDTQGAMPDALLAFFLSKKGYDYYQAQSQRTFDIQEGKKGLNAVNVKLARMAGAGQAGGIAGGVVAGRKGGGASVGKAFVKGGGASVGKASRKGAGASVGKPTPGNLDRVAAIPPFSGEVELPEQVDLMVEGRGLDFVWARTYHSRLGRFDAAANGWTFSYDVRCAQNSTGGIDLFDGTGRKDTFTLQANGTYACAGFFREVVFVSLTTVVRVTFADTGYWEFNALDGSPTAGKLARIVDRNGNTMALNYDAATGQLMEIVDDLGRLYTIGYDADGHVSIVTDFSGRTVTYAYYQPGEKGGSPGDLKSVTSPLVVGTPNGNDFPKGKTTTYTYSSGYADDRENHLLLSITAPSGDNVCTFVYQHNQSDLEFLRCTSFQRGTDTPTIFRYFPHAVNPAQNFASLKCIINDPEGNVTEEYYDARNRCVMAREFTGRATPGQPVTDTSKLPVAKVRDSDPAYYETQCAWNNDSLLRKLRPHSNVVQLSARQIQFLYESDFDPSAPARKRADCRVVRETAAESVDLDGDGVNDISERTWHYEYDPRFGSPASKYFIHAIHAGRSTGIVDGKPNAGGGTWGRRLRSGVIAEVGAGRPATDSTTKIGKGIILCPPTGTRKATDSKGILLIPPVSARAASSTGVRHEYQRFVTSVTDPRGNVTTAGFDTQGNLLFRMRKRPEILYQAWEEEYAYNSHGQLIAVTNAVDANGARRVDTLSYYSSGPQNGYTQSIAIDEQGVHLTTAFECDSRGNVTRLIDPRGSDWLFTYNALDQCVREQSPVNLKSRSITDLYRDQNDNVVRCESEVRAADDTLTGTQVNEFRYDSLGRLVEMALAVDASHALTNRFAYNGNDQCVEWQDGDAVSGADPDQRVAFKYDERGLLYRLVCAPGSAVQSTDQFDYSLTGKLAALHNGLESAKVAFTAWSYDGFDRPATETDPMGNRTAWYLDANDNPKVAVQQGELNDQEGAATNLRLAECRFEYDFLDRCVRLHRLHFAPETQLAILDGEATTQVAWAPCGQCLSVTDDLGHATTFGYDTAGRRVSVIDALGNRRSLICDAGSNPLVEISEELAGGGGLQVFAATNVFDSLSRCVSSTDSAGNRSRWEYDSLGRCEVMFNPREYSIRYGYDLLGRCTLAVGDLDGDGLADRTKDITAQATWSSSSGRLLSTTDSHGNITGYSYDSLDRCTNVTYADGTQYRLIWSPRSNLVGEQDAAGNVISNTYDLNNRIIHRDIAARFESFSYDGCDRLTGAVNNDVGVGFSYDSLGSCVAEIQDGATVVSVCDALGNRRSLAYPGGRTLSYTYDALNRCTAISESGTLVASFAYDGPDRVARVDYGNGTRTRIDYDGFAGTSNAAGDYGFGQISRIRHGLPSGQSIFEDRKFQFDRAQNKTRREMPAPFAIGGISQVQTFEYDLASRLVLSQIADPPQSVLYGLDRMGNRTNVTGGACSGAYTMESASPPADFQMNQYTATPCEGFTYDENGNLTDRTNFATSRQLAFGYDYAGRLLSVSDSGLPVANYLYDALGRRVSRAVYSGGVATTTRFLYSGSDLIETRENGALPDSFVHRTEDGLLMGVRHSGQDYFIHTDDQGNALALTDGTGTVVERYDYQDYGLPQFLTGDGQPLTGADGQPVLSSPAGNAFLFHGMEWDAETGLFSRMTGAKSNPLYEDKGMSGNNPFYDPRTGRSLFNNNPWSPEPPMMKNGTVKFFNEAKGFGFIKEESGQEFMSVRKKDYVGHVTLMK